MLTCAKVDDDEPNVKLEKIGKLYTENQQILEAEHDPTSKTLIKALKVILIGVGLVAGLVPGLIALGVFAKLSHNKTGSMDFLSDEANKTSDVMELKSFLNALGSVGKLGK